MSPVNPAASAAAKPQLPGDSVIDITKHQRMANALRVLAMDAVQAANSGHPGLPMGAADIATVLFTRFLKFDATVPDWPDRDRFVLSAGHGSMLLYGLLHLLGYDDMTIEEIRRFRQLGSKTAGHPEYGFAAGIETTTGPLGQGLANAVGMAIAERLLQARFGKSVVDHHTYVLASDGDLMEGISQEALALAGHLKLGKLIVLFDDNGISIDGPVTLSDSTDQLRRFEASGWHTMGIDGHDPAAIATAIAAARGEEHRPSLIACRTVIGYGAPKKQGTAGVHGSPLGPEEVAAARQALGWPDEPFVIPTEIRDLWRIAGIRSCRHRRTWEQNVQALEMETRVEFERRLRGDLPTAFTGAVTALKQKLVSERPKIATRVASQRVLEVINPILPETVGGSADLTPSNNTRSSDLKEVTPDDFTGRFIHYGIREHGMAAAMNGIALHKGLIPYGGTFLIFSDYCRPAIRLSALMHQRVIFVLTHDSIGLGEDGPTHQPVEHLAALRAIPNLLVLRPADAVETAECWQIALENDSGPSVLALTRQNLSPVRIEADEENLCARGAYEIASTEEDSEVVIFASGSEVEIAIAAKAELDRQGHPTRVVSVPSFELFARQSEAYRSVVLGTEKYRVGIEAAISMGWERFIGPDGVFIGMHGFGASGPYQELYRHFGVTAEAAVAAVLSQISGTKQ